jgi:hypothetical protein
MTTNANPAIFFEELLIPVEAPSIPENPIKIIWDGRKQSGPSYFEKKTEVMYFNPSIHRGRGSSCYFDFINS